MAPVPSSTARGAALLIASAVTASVMIAGCSVGGGPQRPERPTTGSTTGPGGHGGGLRQVTAPPAAFTASDVLRRWDRARARSFAEGDVDALRSLYAPGSRAGAADVRLLRGYLRRGLRVEGMRMQLLTVDVLVRTPRRLRLRVTDRLVGGVAVGSGGRVALPADRASARDLELVRSGAGARWLLVSVSR